MTRHSTGDREDSPVLSIELSQRLGGVAVILGSGRIETIEVAGGRRETDDLAPAIEAVLDRSGLEPASLGSLAVDVGPGGFTGLRISVALAQMLAEVHRLPVYAASSALVAIASTPGLDRAVGVVDVCVAAKRESAWRTRFVRSTVDERWRAAGDGEAIDETGDVGQVDLLLADEHLGAGLRAAYETADVDIATPSFSAAALARLVIEEDPNLRRFEDAAQLLPIYPRIPEAVRVWRNKTPR